MNTPSSEETLATPDGQTYDMTLVYTAERRVFEIATVTPTKAPELMSLFSRACFVLGHHLKTAYLGAQTARKAVLDRKAVVTIDVIPGKLKEKSLTNNEDNRAALLQLDPDYSQLLERESMHDAVLLYLRRKTEDMENALSNVRKIYGETQQIYQRRNPNLSAGGPSTFNDPVEQTFDDPHNPTDPTPAGPVTMHGRVKVGRPNY